MNDEIKRRIKLSGYKKGFIAAHLDIKPSMLSMILRGDRLLKPDKEKLLKQLLRDTE